MWKKLAGLAAAVMTVVATAGCSGGGGSSLFPMLSTTTPPGTEQPTTVYRAYVANAGAQSVTGYTIDKTTGALTSTGTTTASIGSLPNALAIDPRGRFLFVANTAGNSVSAFTINAVSGALVSSGTAATGGNATYVNIDPLGRFVYVTNWDTNDVAVFTVNATSGALTRTDCGGGAGCGITNPKNFAVGTNPYSNVAFDAAGKYAYLAVTGTNEVAQYAIDQATGALSGGVNVSAGPAGTNPTYVAMDPTGKFLYTANGGDSVNPADLSAFTVNAATGALSQIDCGGGAGCNGKNFRAGIYPNAVTIDPSGKYLYAANANDNTVSAYTINAATGALTQVTGSPSSVNAKTFGALSVATDPSGKFLYATSNQDNNVTGFTINGSNGALTVLATSPYAAGTNAAFIATTTTSYLAAALSAKAITSYLLAGVPGTINESAKTVAVAMPSGTNVTALAATFSTTGASVKVGATLQTSGTTTNNFTGPVLYTVTASDGSTATYTVTVTVAPSTDPLPKTGQTASYATGDDGNLQIGAAWPGTRFTTNADTTVTDNLTGLAWTADTNAPGPAACGPGTTKTWQAALDHVACLNANSYLGHADWRLPNRKELRSITDFGQSNPDTWLNGQGFSNAVTGNYWTSTIYINVTWALYAWIGGTDGSLDASNGTSTLRVWPVRSSSSAGVIALPRTGQTTCYDAAGATIACAGTGQDGDLLKGAVWPGTRFTTNADTTVTDNLTGRIWTPDGNTPGPVACGPAVTKTWQGALDHVACLNTNSYLGHTDWRLPNINELESLVDPEQANSAAWLNTQGFSNAQALYYWSSTAVASNTTLRWIIDMKFGGEYGYPKTDSYTVWPVR